MKLAVAVTAAALAAAACQTAEERAASRAERDAGIAELVAARQGAEVDRVCFSSQINGWSELGRDAVLIRRSVNDWYKLELSGTCQPDWAFNAIAIRSRPSSCITRGDRLTTDDPTIRGVCFINAIYEWDEDAPVGEDDASDEAAE